MTAGFTPHGEVAEWIALRRVHEGGVSRLGTRWLQWGEPTPGYVADALNQAVELGRVVLCDPAQGCPQSRAKVTVDGVVRYEFLTDRYRARGLGPDVRLPPAADGL